MASSFEQASMSEIFGLFLSHYLDPRMINKISVLLNLGPSQ